MDEPSDVTQLKARLEEAERNTIMAATYGKQLLDENHELHTRLEDTIKEYSLKLDALEQEKHDITRKYETKVQNERSLILELEHLREQQTYNSKAKQNHEMEIQKLKKMVSSLTSSLENQEAESQQNIDHVALLEAQLKESQEKRDLCNISIQDQSVDDTSSGLQNQMMMLTCEKQDLEKQVSTLKAEVKVARLKLSKAERTVVSLKKEVESLECQCTSYFNTLEQNKEEIVELKMEVESLKLAETDPAKKGNSLFAEVEDQRQAMERQLQDCRSKYNIMKKQYEIKTQQISKMKLQLANLLSLSSNKADAEYVSNLEESLASARCQLEAITKHCKDLELKHNNLVAHPIQPVKENEASEEQNMTTFFKNMYMESQKRVEELDQELQTARFDKVALSDRILQLQRKLRQVETTRDAANSKVITLQVKYEELAAKKGESVGHSSKDAKQITVKEKIPGFENNSLHENKVEHKCQLPEGENKVPLQEVQVDFNTPVEVTSLPDISSTDKDNLTLKPETEAPSRVMTSENQENELALYKEEQKKRPKKSVRMTETVVVQECDGEVQEIHLKKEDGEKLPQPKKKVLKKMSAPVVKVPSGGQPNDCNQQ